MIYEILSVEGPIKTRLAWIKSDHRLVAREVARALIDLDPTLASVPASDVSVTAGEPVDGWELWTCERKAHVTLAVLEWPDDRAVRSHHKVIEVASATATLAKIKSCFTDGELDTIHRALMARYSEILAKQAESTHYVEIGHIFDVMRKIREP